MFSGYLMILVSSILCCIMSALRKEYQEKVEPNLKTTVFFMGLSSLFVCAIGFFYEIFAGFSIIKGIDYFTLILSASFALDLVINTILCIFGSKYGSLAILTVFARLGTLVISAVYGLIYDPVRNEINSINSITKNANSKVDSFSKIIEEIFGAGSIMFTKAKTFSGGLVKGLTKGLVTVLKLFLKRK